MNNKYKFYIAALFSALAACGGGGGGSNSAEENLAVTELSGVSLKGPAVKGSLVTVRPLNNDLTQKGVTYTTSTINQLGEFAFAGSEPLSRYVEIEVSGNYFDEVGGGVSGEKVTLKSLIDTSSQSRPNVNVITHMQLPRIKSLMLSGMTYTEADRQSLAEVINAFGATSGADGLKSAYEMTFDGGGDSSAILLAISAQIMQIGHDARFDKGGSITSGLETFMFELGQDIGIDGELDDIGLIDQLHEAAFTLDVTAIKTNVESYYLSNGSGIIAPQLEEWVDHSGNGGLPHRTGKPVPKFILNDLEDVNAGAPVTSNELTISGVNTGERVQIELSEVEDEDDHYGFGRTSYSQFVSPKLYINSKIVETSNDPASPNFGVSTSSVTKGDVVQVQTIAPVFGKKVEINLKIGSTTNTWEIKTRSPTALYQSENSPAMFYYRDGEDDFFGDLFEGHKKFDAIPLLLDSDLRARHAIVDLKYRRSGTPISFAVYNDDDGIPGDKLFGLVTSFTETFGREPVFYENSEASISGLYRIGNNAVFFGQDGFVFKADQKYWLVYERFENRGATGDGPVDMDSPITMSAAGKPAFGTFMYSNDGKTWEPHPQFTSAEGTFDIAPIVFLID